VALAGQQAALSCIVVEVEVAQAQQEKISPAATNMQLVEQD
jgi:hypothetical protein